MVQCIKTILQNPGFRVSGAPTPIYEDSPPSIDIINKNHLTGQVKNIYVSTNDVHEQYVLLNIDPFKFKTTIQPADIGTKRFTSPLPKSHYYYIRSDQ